MADTSIEWTNAPGYKGVSWNPGRGCQLRSDGCRSCYAMKQAARIISFNRGRGIPEGNGAYDGLVRIDANGKARWNGAVQVADNIKDPLKWRTKRMAFVNSMSDLFYEGFDNAFRDLVMAVMLVSVRSSGSPGHVFQTLTKREREMFEYLSGSATVDRVAVEADKLTSNGGDLVKNGGLVDDHLWFGVSVENQEMAKQRIPVLASTPVAVRFLSIEPILEEIELSGLLDGIHWVIAGAESGDEARPAHEGWFYSLRDRCGEAGVPYFLKQFAVNGRKVPTPELDGVTYTQWPEALSRLQGESQLGFGL